MKRYLKAFFLFFLNYVVLNPNEWIYIYKTVFKSLFLFFLNDVVFNPNEWIYI
jgi:hypothetical protein